MIIPISHIDSNNNVTICGHYVSPTLDPVFANLAIDHGLKIYRELAIEDIDRRMAKLELRVRVIDRRKKQRIPGEDRRRRLS